MRLKDHSEKVAKCCAEIYKLETVNGEAIEEIAEKHGFDEYYIKNVMQYNYFRDQLEWEQERKQRLKANTINNL